MKKKLSATQLLQLQGDLVYLKKLDRQYEEQYITVMGSFDLEARTGTATGQFFTVADLVAHIDRVAGDTSRIDFLIFSLADHQLVGEVVLADLDPVHRSAHLRIVIAQQAYRSRGFGAEALLLALHYGFGMRQLHRIELEVLVVNRRAIRLYERLGFEQEGIRREVYYFNHRYHDVIMMSLLAPVFRSRYLENEEAPDADPAPR